MEKKYTRDILRLLWRASKPYATRRTLLFIVVIFTLIIGNFVTPAIIATFLDMIQHGNLDASALWWLLGGYALAQLWSEVIGWRIAIYLTWTFEVFMQRDLYHRIFAALSRQTLFFHSNTFGGSLVSQSSKLVGALERFWDTLIWSVPPLFISVIGAIIVLWPILWQYALFLLIFSLLFAVAVFFGTKQLIPLNEKEAKASNKISGHLADVMSNILAVKSSATEAQELHTFTAHTKNWKKSALGVMRGFLFMSTGYSAITTTIKISALAFAVYAASHNLVSVASVYLIITYTSIVAQNLWNMNNIMRTYNRVMGDALEMTKILQQDITVVDATDEKLTPTRGKIVIDAVSYTHDEGAGATLFEDFSLTIGAGEKIGLVGASGSGKTTLTKLLLRFADVDSGEITIDGQNIAKITQESLHKNIAYVPQEPLLFHRSVKENIAYARPDASMKDIKKAAKQAGALEFIEQLDDGFETMVGERGVKLSGGQRQRIAIARAILKNAPILILDEATSALDSDSERYIQQSLELLMKKRTSIVIAHRLSTIAKLDKIIVLEQGKIVEQGTHAELIKRGDAYAKLWQHQSGGFIEE